MSTDEQDRILLHTDLLSGDKATITLEHLMSMSSGLEWYQEGRSSSRRQDRTTDPSGLNRPDKMVPPR